MRSRLRPTLTEEQYLCVEDRVYAMLEEDGICENCPTWELVNSGEDENAMETYCPYCELDLNAKAFLASLAGYVVA